MYLSVCSLRVLDSNFIYPSILPQGALFGWKNDYNVQLWPRNGADEEKAKKIIEFLKECRAYIGDVRRTT